MLTNFRKFLYPFLDSLRFAHTMDTTNKTRILTSGHTTLKSSAQCQRP
ncbi:Uncharacterised protein [Klebsiella pneumoniae]|nr:Uncharacterised protein [Klebsiella pneumoniae]